MLLNAATLRRYDIAAEDGNIGSVSDIYFDDQLWLVRYLIVDTGRWLPGRQVLLAPPAFGEPDLDQAQLPTTLTKQQINDSPAADSEQPVSRQYETQLFDYYGWPYYWTLGYPAVGAGMGATLAAPPPAREPDVRPDGDPSLRSVAEVNGYAVAASDGSLGHIEDFIIDTGGWALPYVVVDTRNWLPGRKVLVANSWITRVDWPERQVHIDLSKEQIKDGPEYDPSAPPSRDYEKTLFEHYGKPGYWP